MLVQVHVQNAGEDIPMLEAAEVAELYDTGALRLVFPSAVLRFAVVGTVILQALFEG